MDRSQEGTQGRSWKQKPKKEYCLGLPPQLPFSFLSHLATPTCLGMVLPAVD